MSYHWTPSLEELALYEPENYDSVKNGKGRVIAYELKAEIAAQIDAIRAGRPEHG